MMRRTYGEAELSMWKSLKVVAALVALVALLTVASPASAQSPRQDCAPGQPTGRPPGTPPNQPGPPDGRPPQYPPGQCQLALSQSAAQRGDTFQATGGGFVPGEAVTVRLAGRRLTTATADGNGVFAASLTVPADAPVGRTEVLAAGQRQALSAAFEVLPAAAAGAAGPSGSLPRTGLEVAGMALAGAVLTAAGVVLVLAVRRRQLPSS